MLHSFPPISPFLELIEKVQRTPNAIILRDHSSGKTATARQLLFRVSLLRAELQAILKNNGVTTYKNDDKDHFIYLLAPPGLEYIVAMLTIFSLAAGMSAQSIAVRPEQMKNFFKLANPLAVLYTSSLAEKAEAIKALCAESGGDNLRVPFVEINLNAPDSSDSQNYLCDPMLAVSDQLGTLFFTSGTSGNPKGVVHSYNALLASARERIETWELTSNDVVLNQKPGNWMGGIFGILPSLISGACLETCAGIFNPEWFWERIGKGRVSVFSIAPEGYDRLGEYFDEHISKLPSAGKEIYIEEISRVKYAGVTGSLLLPHTQKRWTELRRGKPLLNLYGSTEVTLICGMRWQDPGYLDMCSIGPSVPGVEVKLVDGEMRLKAPSMFSRYISEDPTQTEKAFDSEGFFKTGDCAEKLGDCYVLHGRANIDVLHFWGFTLHTGEIENALLSLPYIASAIVIPVDDKEYQQRAGAILQIKPSFQSMQPDLLKLRNDLTEMTGLMQFKQPSVVYWLRDGEEIPRTASGKISKKEATKHFFGDGWRCKQSVEVFDLKGMEYWRMGGQC